MLQQPEQRRTRCYILLLLRPPQLHPAHIQPYCQATQHAIAQCDVTQPCDIQRATNACLKWHVMQDARLQWQIREAHTVAELRAIAYLRADSFYVMDSSRSEYTQRVRRRQF